jgi:hypothetical protein
MDNTGTTLYSAEEIASYHNSAEESSVRSAMSTSANVIEVTADEDDESEVHNTIDNGLNQFAWDLPGSYHSTRTNISTPWIDHDSERIQPDEDLAGYAPQIQRHEHNDIFRSDGEFIFPSTCTEFFHGTGWVDGNHYKNRSGKVHDIRKPPRGKCFTCGGDHWRKNCPLGGRRRMPADAFQ